jgi:hypothetical protein
MAYIIGTNRPDTDQNVNGGPQQLVSGTPSMLGQMSSGVQAQTGTPSQSGFTNLQRYIEANKDVSGLQGAITQKQQAITSPFEQAKTEAETQKQNVQTAIGGRTQAETSLREAVEKAKTQPTSLSQADISNIRNLATTFNYDPSAVVNPFAQSLAGLQSKAETSAKGLENLATRTGQRQALMEGRVAPRSSLGGLELDAFLLGASPEAQARFEALPTQASQLRQAINPFQTQLGEFQKVGSLTGEDLQKTLNTELENLRTELDKPRTTLNEPRYGVQQSTLQKAIKDSESTLGRKLNENELRNLISRNTISTREQAFSPEELARYRVMSQLAGTNDGYLTESKVSQPEIDQATETLLERYLRPAAPSTAELQPITETGGYTPTFGTLQGTVTPQPTRDPLAEVLATFNPGSTPTPARQSTGDPLLDLLGAFN